MKRSLFYKEYLSHVKNAFFHKDLQETVHMSPPPSYSSDSALVVVSRNLSMGCQIDPEIEGQTP